MPTKPKPTPASRPIAAAPAAESAPAALPNGTAVRGMMTDHQIDMACTPMRGIQIGDRVRLIGNGLIGDVIGITRFDRGPESYSVATRDGHGKYQDDWYLPHEITPAA